MLIMLLALALRMAEQLGITEKKDGNTGEWYQQVILKSGLADYSPVSGCMILRPKAYHIWEQIQKFFDAEIRKLGVQNCYFPLLIPESLLGKESEHVEGFKPEVAWVTHGGDSQLPERLAIRPTSETIMYDAYSRWIRSHNDLPLKLNQWCNVVRWEFKHPMPFLRTREFLWQEGHTAHATSDSAEQEVYQILDLYASVFEELLAVPVMKGIKSEKEKFAGAVFTTSVETLLPNGKAIQGATSHHLGQNFSKAFGIDFLDEKGEKQHPWQNSWGISTRSIGIMVMMHSDDKGLVLPPAVAPIEAVIVPIYKEDTRVAVLEGADEAKRLLKGRRVWIDNRDYTPGWKFHDAELQGIPLRIELGPKDLEKRSAVVVRRDTGTKEVVALADLTGRTTELLAAMQRDLLESQRKRIAEQTVDVASMDELKAAIDARKMARMPWCGTPASEEKIKDATGGAKSINRSRDIAPTEPCALTGERAQGIYSFAKSY